MPTICNFGSLMETPNRHLGTPKKTVTLLCTAAIGRFNGYEIGLNSAFGWMSRWKWEFVGYDLNISLLGGFNPFEKY